MTDKIKNWYFSVLKKLSDAPSVWSVWLAGHKGMQPPKKGPFFLKNSEIQSYVENVHWKNMASIFLSLVGIFFLWTGLIDAPRLDPNLGISITHVLQVCVCEFDGRKYFTHPL